jgi:hypothetical protein
MAQALAAGMFYPMAHFNTASHRAGQRIALGSLL